MNRHIAGKIAVFISGPIRYVTLVSRRLEHVLRECDYDCFFHLWKADLSNKVRLTEDSDYRELDAHPHAKVVIVQSPYSEDDFEDTIGTHTNSGSNINASMGMFFSVNLLCHYLMQLPDLSKYKYILRLRTDCIITNDDFVSLLHPDTTALTVPESHYIPAERICDHICFGSVENFFKLWCHEDMNGIYETYQAGNRNPEIALTYRYWQRLRNVTLNRSITRFRDYHIIRFPTEDWEPKCIVDALNNAGIKAFSLNPAKYIDLGEINEINNKTKATQEERWPAKEANQRLEEENKVFCRIRIADTKLKMRKENLEDTYRPNGLQPLTIRTMSGRVLDFPELPSADSLPPEVPAGHNEIIEDVHKWSNPRLAYLASADQWLGFEEFFRKSHLMQCDVFYCVIGGLGGVNLLALLKPLRKIVFYDANIYAAMILNLQLQLIRHCSCVNEYISLIYQRPFDSSKYSFDNQTDFLKLPIDQEYGQTLKQVLSGEAYNTYNHFYLPYIRQLPDPLYDGPSVLCTHLLPFFESDCVREPLVSGIKNTCVNINTFYVGKGWLSGDKTFRAVRSHLLETEIEVLIGDVAEIRPKGKFTGVYTTNIYNTGKKDGYRKFIHLFKWLIGFDDATNWEVQYYPNDKSEGMVEYEKLVGEGNGNPHATCCQAIDGLLDLNDDEFLEIIEPPPSEGMNYGFRFYRGQKPILVQDYLNTAFLDEKIILIHILLGGGTPQRLWRRVCQKAVRESNRYILIFEHRKECADWPQNGVYDDNLLPHDRLDQFIYSLDYRWRKFGIANVKGDISDARNIIYFLEKTGHNDINGFHSVDRYAITNSDIIPALKQGTSDILAEIQANDSNNNDRSLDRPQMIHTDCKKESISMAACKDLHYV